MLSPRQFAPPGDEKARKQLLKQLAPQFPDTALSWLRDPAVTVESPSKVPAESIDWDDYPNWRASHELKKVQKLARKKDKKPSVLAQSPGDEQMFIVDGHHHALARVDREKDPIGWIVHVPAKKGPWSTMHDKETGDTNKPDFPGEQDKDRD